MSREKYDQHNSWPGNPEEILQRMQDAERLKQVGERFPIEMSPTNEPTGWDRLGGLDPLGDRSELIRTTGGGGRKGFLGLGGRYPTWEHTYDTDTGISTIDREGYGTTGYRTVTDPDGYMREEMIPDFSPMLSEEETNQRKWGLLNSVVDAIKAGGSKLGDFLYDGADINYTDANEQDRMRAAEEQRKREFAEELRKKAAEEAYTQSINSRAIRQEPYRQGTLGLDLLGRTIVNYYNVHFNFIERL